MAKTQIHFQRKAGTAHFRNRFTAVLFQGTFESQMIFRTSIISLLMALGCVDAAAQSPRQFLVNPISTKPATGVVNAPAGDPTSANEIADTGNPVVPKTANAQFRVERLPIANGAELLTIFGRLDSMRATDAGTPEVPLISVVRDTLADTDPDNDRLSYVWMLTYTRPNLMKRFASAIPFLYQHVGNQRQASTRLPKPIIDLANPKQQTWNRFFWMGMQSILLDGYGLPLKASSRTYRRNAADYRSDHVMQALSILDTYERLRLRSRTEGEMLALGEVVANNTRAERPINDTPRSVLSDLTPAFRPGEMLELRARLILSRQTLGGLVGPETFYDTVTHRTVSSIDNSGHNWELLRQRAEAEGLYFEPLAMPDGQATHALLWIAKADLTQQPQRRFHDRFLNIGDPWSDDRLRNWNGYSRVAYLDSSNRPVRAGDPDARAVEMIPLALYGLDHPKIPALLIDFRHSLNPKKREMSRRLLNDVANNMFSLSNFGNLPYFAGRGVYDFITGRRGMDLNQPTRLESYSELKLLLSFNSSIDPKLRQEIERRIQNVSLNPLNNDNETEVRLAQQQYASLMDYAGRPDGLPAKIERDRRAEMVALEHGRPARFFYNLANVLSFGRYVHREKATPELFARLEKSRRLGYHTQFLNQVAKSSSQTDVAWDMEKVTRSLQFLAGEGDEAPGAAAKAAAAIFQKTSDAEARRLCLEALSRINNRTARHELVKIFQHEQPQSELRAEVADRLRKAVAADVRVKPAEARSLLNQVGQQ
ncbi:MAG TPA: hypothetical protein VGC60_16815 [Pyrinomonadaceae bacterium]